MKKTNKYITAAALCSTIMIGGLQAPSISYAASNQSIVAPSAEVKLLEDFKRELKQKIDNQEENITLKYNTKESDARSVMNMLYQEYNKIVDADEYVKYNIASTRLQVQDTLYVDYQEIIRLHYISLIVSQRNKHNM